MGTALMKGAPGPAYKGYGCGLAMYCKQEHTHTLQKTTQQSAELFNLHIM